MLSMRNALIPSHRSREFITQMKDTKQYFPVVLFIILNKVIQTFHSVDRIRKCGHSNESYPAKVSCGTVYHNVLQLILIKPQAEVKTPSVSLLLRMSFLFKHACSSKSHQIDH